VLRVNVNLLEMSDRGLEDLDMRKPNGNILRKGNPEVAVSLSSLQYCIHRCLGENGLRCVARKESGSGEFYRW
jgi:hypothetical protein